ncbi:hypothetical protein SDC9_193234 [bioreactor metagenome]|uniref:Transketolase n=1 Tax=bioreactor metagenome TaxID=1076179 RepID=A0A645I301_9ZZZZ
MDTFGESGQPKDLLQKYNLTDKAIVDACIEVSRLKNNK